MLLLLITAPEVIMVVVALMDLSLVVHILSMKTRAQAKPRVLVNKQTQIVIRIRTPIQTIETRRQQANRLNWIALSKKQLVASWQMTMTNMNQTGIDIVT